MEEYSEFFARSKTYKVSKISKIKTLNTANAVKNDDGYPESLKRVQKITGKSLTFYELDIREKTKLEEVFEKHKIDSVLHFAGLKSVNESVSQPLEYYNNNISGQLKSLNQKC